MADTFELEMEQAKLNLKQQALFMKNYEKMTDLIESVPSFAADEDENTWKVLDSLGTSVQYTEDDITSMRETACKLYYTNPSAAGLIDTMVNFIIGKYANVEPAVEDEDVNNYWKKFQRVNRWNRRSRELVKRSLRDGEDFLRFFMPSSRDTTDLVSRIPFIRFVEPSEITSSDPSITYGIETDPEDVERVIKYHRSYNVGNNTKTSEIDAKYIVHTKIRVDSNVKRGLSFFVGLAKYIVKYESWLNDRIMLNKLRTLFNVVMKVQGITPSAFKEKFEDQTSKNTTGTDSLNKKLPKPGSVLVQNPGVEYEMMNLNIRAQDTRDDGRNIELMLSKGTQMTEYITRGDASNANYSSTMVAESPMVRMFESWQDFYEDEFKEIYARAIYFGKKTGEVSESASDECNVNFPGLIHRDIEKETKAMVLQVGSKLCSAQTASENLGYNFSKEMDRIAKEEKNEYLRTAQMMEHEHDETE